jgi:hypothetical protein
MVYTYLCLCVLVLFDFGVYIHNFFFLFLKIKTKIFFDVFFVITFYHILYFSGYAFRCST